MIYDLVYISAKYVESSILLFRGKQVILDRDLASFYGVSIGKLNRAIKRNPERFPRDFRFQLTLEETKAVEATRKPKTRGRQVKCRPYVYTEPGISMLPTVFRSERIIQVNILIMRTFLRLRER